MPTFPLPNSKRTVPRQRGFTLLELLAVTVLTAVLLGLTIPQFESLFRKSHNDEFAYLVRTLKVLRNDAILKNRQYFLIFDTKERQIRIEELIDGKRVAPLARERLLRPHAFAEDLEFEITLGEEDTFRGMQLGQFNTAREISIDGSGFITPFRLVLRDPKKNLAWLIRTKGIMGQLAMQTHEG